MISHQHRCIFIHIPRTAGTSIEVWLNGQNQWRINPKEKHLTALEAKRVYAQYWNDYFKFSFVRHPIQRTLSCFKHATYFRMDPSCEENPLALYKQQFGYPLTIEHDYRFSTYDEIYQMGVQEGVEWEKNSVYGNFLSVPIDKIYRYEELANATRDIREILGVKQKFDIHTKASPKELQGITLSDNWLRDIQDVYARDFSQFGYANIESP